MEEIFLKPTNLCLDDPNDALVPLIIEFDSLFQVALGKSQTLGTSGVCITPLNIVYIVETILLDLKRTKKPLILVYFDAFENYYPSSSIRLVRLLLTHHLDSMQKVDFHFKRIKDSACDAFWDILTTTAPYCVVINSNRSTSQFCHLGKVLEMIRSDVASIYPVLDFEDITHQNGMEGAALINLKFYHSLEKIEDFKGELKMGNLTKSGKSEEHLRPFQQCESALSNSESQRRILHSKNAKFEDIWIKHLQLMETISLASRSFSIFGNWALLDILINSICGKVAKISFSLIFFRYSFG